MRPETETPPADPPKPGDPGQPPENPTPPEPTPEPQGEGASERIRKLNEKARKADEARLEAERKLREREEADLSEKERAERRATEAEAKATEAENAAAKLRRETWIERAARTANFHDPEDAVARLSTTEIDDERAAKDAVKKLAEKAPHLVGSEQRPGGFGNLGGGGTAEPEVPTGPDGKPDYKAGLGKDLLGGLFARRT